MLLDIFDVISLDALLSSINVLGCVTRVTPELEYLTLGTRERVLERRVVDGVRALELPVGGAEVLLENRCHRPPHCVLSVSQFVVCSGISRPGPLARHWLMPSSRGRNRMGYMSYMSCVL